jgi:hypothetical protein
MQIVHGPDESEKEVRRLGAAAGIPHVRICGSPGRVNLPGPPGGHRLSPDRGGLDAVLVPCAIGHETCLDVATMNILRAKYTLPLAITGLLFACGGANQGPAVTGTAEPPASPTGSQKGADTAVVDRLAEARCDQEQGCKNIGPSAKYVSRAVCMDQLRGSIANDLNTYNCPGGLDSAGVDRCMAAIKSEECNHPFDTLTRYDKCRTGALCMK